MRKLKLNLSERAIDYLKRSGVAYEAVTEISDEDYERCRKLAHHYGLTPSQFFSQFIEQHPLEIRAFVRRIRRTRLQRRRKP